MKLDIQGDNFEIEYFSVDSKLVVADQESYYSFTILGDNICCCHLLYYYCGSLEVTLSSNYCCSDRNGTTTTTPTTTTTTTTSSTKKKAASAKNSIIDSYYHNVADCMAYFVLFNSRYTLLSFSYLQYALLHNLYYCHNCYYSTKEQI